MDRKKSCDRGVGIFIFHMDQSAVERLLGVPILGTSGIHYKHFSAIVILLVDFKNSKD